MDDVLTKNRKQAVSNPGKPVPRRPGFDRATQAILRSAAQERPTAARMVPLSPEQRALGARRAAAISDQLAMRAQEDAETHRLMTNWARWKSGASVGAAMSSAYDLEARGRRELVSTPLLNGEAAEVDAAVVALPSELYDVITVRWLGKIRPRLSRVNTLHSHGGDPLERVRASTAREQAAACRLPLRSYYRRLAHAHARIRALMHARRNDAARRQRHGV